MKCPKCEQIELESRVVEDVEVDRCPDCGGIWFDQDELSKTLSLNASELKPLTKGKERPELNKLIGTCPVDQTGLIRVCSQHNRSIILDRCPECLGVWLDGGEFKRLIKKA